MVPQTLNHNGTFRSNQAPIVGELQLVVVVVSLEQWAFEIVLINVSFRQ